MLFLAVYLGFGVAVLFVMGVWSMVRLTNLENRVRELETHGTKGHAPHAERPAAPEFARHQEAAAPPAPRAEKTEFKIGASFYSVVGGLAVLLGLGFLLRYAIENNLISAGMRVLLGLVVGVVLVGLGAWLGPKMKRYAHVLTGTGLGAWYLSLYAASQIYALMPLETAFIGMMVVTALGVFLAWRADAELLAAFAGVGGYLTPLVLSSGENRPHVLFPYLTILSCAMLLVAFKKKAWRSPVLVAAVGTVVVYAAWAVSFARGTDVALALAYLTLLFLPFLGRTLYRAQTEPKTDALDYLLLFLSPLLYVYAGQTLLWIAGDAWTWCFTLALSVLYLALAGARAAMHRRGDGICTAFIAIGTVLLAVTAAVYFDAMRWTVAAWALEALALHWVAKRLGSTGLDALAVGLSVCAGFWAVGKNETVASLVCLVPFVVRLAADEGQRMIDAAKRTDADTFHFVGTHVFALWVLAAEILRAGTGNAAQSAVTVAWLLYAVALTAYGIWRKDRTARYAAVALFAVTTWKIVMIDTADLDNFYRFVVFISLGVLLLLSGFLYNRFKAKIE